MLFTPPADIGHPACSSSSARGCRRIFRQCAARTGRLVNPAVVTADQGPLGQGVAETLVTAPKLAFPKHAPEEALICEPINYVLTVRNTANAPAGNVRIRDELPEGLTSEAGWRLLSYEIGPLASNRSRQVRFSAKATQTGRVGASGEHGLEIGLGRADRRDVELLRQHLQHGRLDERRQ